MAIETSCAPVLPRIQISSAEKQRHSALQRLNGAAAQRVAELMRALERVPDRPYLNELAGIAARLRDRDIEGALRGWRSIPWTYENERGFGGLAIYESRDTRVKTAAKALETALARLKVCFRYSYVPEPAPQMRSPREPLLF